MSIKPTSYGSGGAPPNIKAATAAAVAPTPSLAALEEVFCAQLEQRMSEIRASFTRWNLLLGGVVVAGLSTIWMYEEQIKANGCYDETIDQAIPPACVGFECDPSPKCKNPNISCPTPYVALTGVKQNVMFVLSGLGLVKIWRSRDKIRSGFFHLVNGVTQLWPKAGLNEAMFRTLSAVEKTRQFALLETPESSQPDTRTLTGELRKRRRFFFSVSILPKLNPISLASPDFEQRMNSVIKTLLVDERGLEQLRDIRRCRQILMQNTLSDLLTRIGQVVATSELIIEYYIERPLPRERADFEYNHPLFW